MAPYSEHYAYMVDVVARAGQVAASGISVFLSNDG